MLPPIVLFGGMGPERRVSVASGKNVARALETGSLWFVDPAGAVIECARDSLLAHDRPFEVDFRPESGRRWRSVDDALDAAPPGAVFVLALHGTDGESGRLQGSLESRCRAFTGSGSAASEIAFDKLAAKSILAAAGAPTAPDSIVPRSIEAAGTALRDFWERHGPFVLKPVAGGSSVGLRVVRRREDLEAALQSAPFGDEPYLAEKFVSGIELTVGFIEAPSLRALPPSEIRVEAGKSFDYEGKYLGTGALEITPARIATSAVKVAQKLAILAHRSIGCFGYSRTDMILDEAGRVTYLETNTLPGLTAVSFVPEQLKAAEVAFVDFLHAQIAIAAVRARSTATA